MTTTPATATQTGNDQTRSAPEQAPPQQHRDQDGRHEHDGELDQVIGPWPLIARATETLGFEERREEATHPRERAEPDRHPDSTDLEQALDRHGEVLQSRHRFDLHGMVVEQRDIWIGR